jgi:acetyl esterase/lipase
MSDRFLARQLITLGLTANATRPIPGGPASVPAFFAGWLTAELAPQLLTATALDAIGHVARHGLGSRRDRLGLAAAAISSAGYAALIRAGNRAGAEVEHALREALGADYAEHLGRSPEPGDLATPWRQLAWPFRMRHVDVVKDRRLPYAPGGRRFEMDIYRRRDLPVGRPVLLQVHGGGWMIGSKQQQGIPLMLQMAARGWVCVAVNYPLSPRARWPEHLIAVKRAMAWIREHGSDYGADASFVAVTGGSAGGHLAAMLALTADDKSLQPGFEDVDTAVQACVPHYGVYDLTAESGSRASKDMLENLTSRFVMSRQASYPDDYRAASPLSRVAADAPPFFVIHGSNDTLVPVREADRFVDRLRAVSDNPVAYAKIGGAQHAFDIFPSIRSAHVVRGVERFLDWTLTRAATHGAEPHLPTTGRTF